jgi:hypothetical protein
MGLLFFGFIVDEDHRQGGQGDVEADKEFRFVHVSSW